MVSTAKQAVNKLTVLSLTTNTNFADGDAFTYKLLLPMLCGTEGAAETALAPQGMLLCARGCFPEGDSSFGGLAQTVVTSGLPGCPLPTMAAHIPLPPPSEE